MQLARDGVPYNDQRLVALRAPAVIADAAPGFQVADSSR